MLSSLLISAREQLPGVSVVVAIRPGAGSPGAQKKHCGFPRDHAPPAQEMGDPGRRHQSTPQTPVARPGRWSRPRLPGTSPVPDAWAI